MADDAVSPDPEISVVIPCYNEEENAAAIITAVIAELEKVGNSFEIILIDNASADNTVAIIKQRCADDPRIRLIVNTANFGQMRSPTHAIYQARGRAVIGICADFQDPPQLIGPFVERWRAGADIVLGVRRSEKTGRLLGWSRSLSYSLARRFGDHPLIPNATGFGLYDGKVVAALRNLREPEPFFRGMLVESGYTIATIAYDRPPRAAGNTGNNFFTLLDFALSALAGFSRKLVRLPLLVACLAAAAALLSLLAALVSAIAGGPILPWLIGVFIEAQFALMFLALGVIGNQTRLIADRTRQTPLVFERERINFPADY